MSRRSVPSLIKVLIVDDSESVARRLTELLSELSSIEIIGPAYNGQDAVRLFNEFQPQVLILDLQLPGITGFEILRIVRESAYDGLIIVLTGYDQPEFLHRCLAAGADFFLSKSTEFERVPEIIRGLLPSQP